MVVVMTLMVVMFMMSVCHVFKFFWFHAAKVRRISCNSVAKFPFTRVRAPKNEKRKPCDFLFRGDPLGARTRDPNIKSVVLYQLS